MQFKGTVLNSSTEDREMTGKDGNKRKAKIAHVLLDVKDGESREVVNIRSYDPEWTLPDIGKVWTSPRVKKYENYDGMVGDATV